MSDDPFSSPSPFGDQALPPAGRAVEPPAAPRPVAAVPPRAPGRRRALAVVAGVAAACLVAAVGFAGGYEVGQGAVPSSAAAGLRNGNFGNFGNGAAGSGAPAGRFGPGRGNGGGGTAGTISSVSPDQLTVSTAGGGSKLVLVNASTTVTKVSSSAEALTDLSQGETVTVVGTANPDGSVTATQIVVGQADGLFGAGRSRQGAHASPVPTAVP